MKFNDLLKVKVRRIMNKKKMKKYFINYYLSFCILTR